MELSIGEVAEATGLSVHALRWFEREGLFLREIPRNTTGRRVFGTSDVEWLELCNRLRESGMPIARLRRFAELVRQGPGTEPQRLQLLREHETAVRAKMAELRKNLAVIARKVHIYEAHVREGTAAGVWEPGGLLAFHGWRCDAAR